MCLHFRLAARASPSSSPPQSPPQPHTPSILNAPPPRVWPTGRLWRLAGRGLSLGPQTAPHGLLSTQSTYLRNSTTALLPNGSARSGKSAGQPEKSGMRRPKRNASMTSLELAGEGRKQKRKTRDRARSLNMENNAAGFLRCMHKKRALWRYSIGRILLGYLLYFLLRL